MRSSRARPAGNPPRTSTISAYELTPGPPKYFSVDFGKNKITPTDRTDWYDYKDRNSFWVDFANVRLGGGVFGNGTLEEEIMCCGTPDLANAAALGIETRSGGNAGEGPSAGNPLPVAIMGVHRVVDIGDLYRKSLENIALSDLDRYLKPLSQAQQFNVLAIAAPKLPNKDLPTQTTQKAINDLFTSFVAGSDWRKIS